MKTTINVLAGKLATEDTAAQKDIRKQLTKKDIEEIRERIANDLKYGRPIELAPSGDVTEQTGEHTKLLIPKGKLSYCQWYEREPERLKDEIEGMKDVFPQFKLYKKEDGRYYWYGTLRPGVLPDGWAWEVVAIYNNDHPKPCDGGSVKVVLLNPDIDTVINALGWKPHHLLYSETDGTYLCTIRAEDMSYGTQYETTVAQILAVAVKWLTALELVMTGDLSMELFNEL
jgi:hypothetical protein